MVLKIVHRVLVSQPEGSKEMGCIQTDRFFDGFHNVIVENIDNDKEPILESAYCFTRGIGEARNRYFKKITLVGDNSSDTIIADNSYEVYLMSDTGKTIEKLN